jgi:DNA-binding transcriptional MerR regulator
MSASVAAEAGRRNGKSAAAFRTISEVGSDLDVPSHVLRFWESKFAQVRPLKRGGGRRYYRPEDVELLRQIRSLLYDDGYTIKGVQKLLRDGGLRPGGTTSSVPAAAETLSVTQRRALGELLGELEDLRSYLRGS